MNNDNFHTGGYPKGRAKPINNCMRIYAACSDSNGIASTSRRIRNATVSLTAGLTDALMGILRNTTPIGSSYSDISIIYKKAREKYTVVLLERSDPSIRKIITSNDYKELSKISEKTTDECKIGTSKRVALFFECDSLENCANATSIYNYDCNYHQSGRKRPLSCLIRNGVTYRADFKCDSNSKCCV